MFSPRYTDLTNISVKVDETINAAREKPFVSKPKFISVSFATNIKLSEFYKYSNRKATDANMHAWNMRNAL